MSTTTAMWATTTTPATRTGVCLGFRTSRPDKVSAHCAPENPRLMQKGGVHPAIWLKHFFDAVARTLLAWCSLRRLCFMGGTAMQLVYCACYFHYCTKGTLFMTSTERHEARYQRRKAKREAKRRARSEACGSFEDIFSYANLYRSGHICSRGVGWEKLYAILYC